MKRTLIAIGIAVILSLMFVPHGGTSDHRSWDESHFGIPTDENMFPVVLPSGNLGRDSPSYFTELIVQTTFLAVVAAVIVNLFPRRR